MTTEATEKTCQDCGHLEDAHEGGDDCQEDKCECTKYNAGPEPEEAEPIPETRGPA